MPPTARDTPSTRRLGSTPGSRDRFAVGRRHQVFRDHQYPRSRAEQVDLDQVHATLLALLLLLLVELAPGAPCLVRRAEQFSHRDDAPPRLQVDDLDESLRHRLIGKANAQRLGDGHAATSAFLCRTNRLAPTALDDTDIPLV